MNVGRWSKIAQHLPGRTDNEIKNYWRTRIQKHARHLRVDTDGRGFLEIFKHSRMIRCLQKAKEESPSSTISIQNQPIPFEGISHYSAIGTMPTQIPCQRTCMNEGGPNYLDQYYEQNSDSEHNNGLCMSSTESTNIPNMTHPLRYTATSQFPALDINNSDFGIFAYDGYHINDNNAYEMDDIDALNLTTTNMVAEDLEYQMGDCYQISEENNWQDQEFACSTWNMNEFMAR